jgi:hypothetical protein
MNAGKAIFNLLSTNDTIKQYIGSKIYPVRIPQGTGFPAIVYAFTDQNPTLIKDGVSPLDEVGLTITMYFDSYDEGQTVADTVRNILDGKRETVAGVTIDSIIFASQQDNDFIEEYGFFVLSQSYQMRLKR